MFLEVHYRFPAKAHLAKVSQGSVRALSIRTFGGKGGRGLLHKIHLGRAFNGDLSPAFE